jgi:IclR family transcriptional regulator, KDG regulon repressor
MRGGNRWGKFLAKALEKARTKPGPDEGGRSARRVLSIFDFMLDRGEPVTVAEVVAELEIPKSTAYELVRTLSAAGYLERSGAAAFFLGRKLFELGMAYRSQVDLLKEGSKVVEELRDETGETVQLSVLESNVMLVLVKEESSKPIRIISRVGSRVPINWAAAGRLLVSDLPDQELRALLQRIVKPSPTGRAPTDPDELVRQIKRFRTQGYGVELNEANEHAGCVAAPVTDVSGRCVAAISIVAPEQRLQRRQRDVLVAAVRRAAEKLSRRLGGR